jgi:outer membrane immunogenic protein
VVLKVPSAAAIVLIATGAYAADLPQQAPPGPPVASGPSWTGCFIGAHVGGAFSQDEKDSRDLNASGVIGGGQAGCDYQFASAFLLGAEGRVARSSLTATTSGTVVNLVTGATAPSQFTVSNNFLASATARAGYTFGGVLVYARGGAAWTGEKADQAFIAPGLGVAVDPSASTTRAGWTAGAGVDWAFAPHWTMEVKYDYYDFGSNSFLLTDPNSGVTVTGTLKDRIQTVTIGSSYHF